MQIVDVIAPYALTSMPHAATGAQADAPATSSRITSVVTLRLRQIRLPTINRSARQGVLGVTHPSY
jgi:hypothetical protein